MPEKIGHYTIVSELGRGGMGIVYKAHEDSLNRFVAIKVLTEKLTEDDTFLQRFVREARAAAGVSHPNIAQIYYIGEDADHPYFVMEYVSGQSLNRMLRAEGRIGNPRAAQLILQAAHGLAAAHDRGIIHRDIKPANLMLDERGMVKIADFGLALPVDAESRLTATGLLMGTPGYLAPEQCRGEKIDHRTDIYALGVTFYELLSGTTPFKGESPLALLRQILDEEAPDISSLNPDVDVETRRILEKMIAKDREQRYQSCHEIVADLEEYLASHGVRSVTAGLATRPATAAPGTVPAPMQPTQVLFSQATPAPSAAHDAPTALVASPEPSTQPDILYREPDTIVPRGNTAVAPAFAAAAAVPPAAPAVHPGPSAYAAAAGPAAYAANAAAPAQAAPPPARKSSRKPLLLILLAFLLVGAAGVAFVGYKIYGKYQSAREYLTSAGLTSAPTTPSTTSSTTTTSTNASAMAGTPSSDVLLSQQMNPPSTDTAAVPGQSAAVAPNVAPAGQSSVPANVAGSGGNTVHVASGNGASSATPAHGGIVVPAHVTTAVASHGRALSGVAVAVTGDGALVGPVSSVLTSELESAGLKTTDAGTLPATEDMLRRGDASASRLIDRLRNEGHAVLVLARVDPTGQRELNYMGRSDTAYSARVTVTSYDLATGRPLGSGRNATIEYTSRTADRESEKVMGPLARAVAEAIQNR